MLETDATMQIASAVGEGAKAAMMIREYLDSHVHDYPEKNTEAPKPKQPISV